MNTMEILNYKCRKDDNIGIIALSAMSSLNLIEDLPLNGNFEEQFKRHYNDISFLGSSWQEINENFQNHLIDCLECRKLYLSHYKTYSNLVKGYKMESILSEARDLINPKYEAKI